MVDATDLRILWALRLLRAAAATVPLDRIAGQLGLLPHEAEARTDRLTRAGYLIREPLSLAVPQYRLSLCGEAYLNFCATASSGARHGS